MPDNPHPFSSSSFRQGLFSAQKMTPALRDAYQKELDALLHQPKTLRQRIPSIVLLVILLACCVGEARTLLVSHDGATFYIGPVTMLVACAVASVWIISDLRKARIARISVLKISNLFYGAMGILTLATLIHGLAAPSDPKSTFDALYVFVFLVVCLGWRLHNCIYAAALANREQILWVECRLAELSEQMLKMQRTGS